MDDGQIQSKEPPPGRPCVLGVDPGLNITGYGLLEIAGSAITIREAGIVRTKAHTSLEARLVEIHQGIQEIIRGFEPTAIAVEQLFSHYQRPRTAILMGHARGVICLAAAEAKLPVHHYAATQVKKMLTGSGRASKSQVQLAVCHEFRLATVPSPPDVADALAIALCHIHFQRRAEKLS